MSVLNMINENERTGCIYMATVLSSGKSYIGYSVNFAQRKQRQLQANENTGISRAIRKYGRENVYWRILSDGIPERCLGTHERYWIAFYDTYRSGYNQTEGGENPPQTSEARAKQSALFKARGARGELWCQSDEGRAQLSVSQQARVARGEHHMQDPSVRAKNSATQRAKASRGEHQSQQPEAKEKMSAAAKANAELGIHQSQQPSVRAKMSASGKRRQIRERLERWQEAGQAFLVPMEVDREAYEQQHVGFQSMLKQGAAMVTAKPSEAPQVEQLSLLTEVSDEY